VTIRLFCEPLTLCTRHHSYRVNDIDMRIFSFAERGHAEQFREPLASAIPGLQAGVKRA